MRLTERLRRINTEVQVYRSGTPGVEAGQILPEVKEVQHAGGRDHQGEQAHVHHSSDVEDIGQEPGDEERGTVRVT